MGPDPHSGPVFTPWDSAWRAGRGVCGGCAGRVDEGTHEGSRGRGGSSRGGVRGETGRVPVGLCVPLSGGSRVRPWPGWRTAQGAARAARWPRWRVARAPSQVCGARAGGPTRRVGPWWESCNRGTRGRRTDSLGSWTYDTPPRQSARRPACGALCGPRCVGCRCSGGTRLQDARSRSGSIRTTSRRLRRDGERDRSSSTPWGARGSLVRTFRAELHYRFQVCAFQVRMASITHLGTAR